jgi:hypothetical protein
MATPATLQEPADFSLVLGGSLYQMLWQAHLTGPALELLRRRLVTALLSLSWLPLADRVAGHRRTDSMVSNGNANKAR